MRAATTRLNIVGIFAIWTLVVGLSMALAPKATAQVTDPSNDRLCDGLSTCAGTNGTTTIVTTNGLPNLSFSNVGGAESGTAYLVILVPSTTDQSLGFTVNGTGSGITDKGVWNGTDNIFDFVGQSYANNVGFGTGNGDFSNLGSAAHQSGIATPTGFNVYAVNLGSYTSGTNIAVTLGGISGFPPGTVFWGYVVGSPQGGGTCSSGTVCAADDVPLSEAVTATPGVTPEPASIALMGSGLLMLGSVLRRRLGKI